MYRKRKAGIMDEKIFFVKIAKIVGTGGLFNESVASLLATECITLLRIKNSLIKTL